MKKYTFLLVTLLAVIMSVTVFSCKKHDGDGPSKSAKYLTTAEFAKSYWEGVDSNNNPVSLDVSSETVMTLTYYEVVSVAKDTQDKLNKVVVKISYTFDDAQGNFSGTGDDSKTYSGALKSTSKMDFNLSGTTVELTKK